MKRHACSCASVSEAAALETTDLAFEGYVEESWQEPLTLAVLYRFNPTHILKGKQSREPIQVVMDSKVLGSCGRQFFPEVKYRIYTRVNDGNLTTDLCSSKLIPTGKEALPIDEVIDGLKIKLDDNIIVRSVDDRLIASGCTLIERSAFTQNCLRETDQSELICHGKYISVLMDTNGTYDQHEFAFRWNRRSDEMAVLGPSQLFVEPSECEVGMNNNFRFNQSKVRKNDLKLSAHFDTDERVVFAQTISINGELYTVATAFNSKANHYDSTKYLYVDKYGNSFSPLDINSQ